MGGAKDEPATSAKGNEVSSACGGSVWGKDRDEPAVVLAIYQPKANLAVSIGALDRSVVSLQNESTCQSDDWSPGTL